MMTENSKHRILIADDNEANVELLEAYLGDLDVETAIAVDGQDTLEDLWATQWYRSLDLAGLVLEA